MPRYRVTIDYGRRVEYVVNANTKFDVEQLFNAPDDELPEPEAESETILNFAIDEEV